MGMLVSNEEQKNGMVASGLERVDHEVMKATKSCQTPGKALPSTRKIDSRCERCERDKVEWGVICR